MIYLKDKKLKTLLGNVCSLASLQALNYLLPVLILPFLVSSIGVDNIGIISTAFALTIYFQMFGDYGFNLTATKEVSKNRGDKVFINEVFTAIFYIKICFLLVGFLFYILVVKLTQSFIAEEMIFLISFLIPIGQVMFPTWLFQGLEKMKFITIINAITKITGAIITVLIVKSPEDTPLVPLINGVAAICATLFAFTVAYLSFNVRLGIINKKIIKILLIEGWYVFQSRIFTTLYKNSNIIILSLFAHPSAVGIYSILDRVIRSVQMIQNVIGDALFPYINRNVRVDDIVPLLKKHSRKAFCFYFSLTVCIIIFSPIISYLLLRSLNVEFICMLSSFSLVLFFGGLSYYYGVLGLISIGETRIFSRAVIATGVINIIVCVFLTKYYGLVGAVICSILSELLLLSFIIIILHRLEMKK